MTQITAFVPPRLTAQARLIEMATAKPWLQALLDHLPDGPPAELAERERLMAEVFKNSLYDTGLNYRQSQAILNHSVGIDDVIYEEFMFLLGDRKQWPIYRIWAKIWEAEKGEDLKHLAKYYVALLARLYRLRYYILGEATDEAA